ncbi:MAG: hypothetical protein ABJA16_11705 [Nakamurella sp.]
MPSDSATSSQLAPSAARVDARLGLVPGLRLVERDDATLQIGIDPPRRILIRHPPPATAEVFRLIDRGVPVSVATRRVALHHRLAPESWNALLEELLAAGFLVDRSTPAGHAALPAGRPRSIAPATTDVRPLGDAVVVVIGTGRVASSLASLLAAAGTGHVHLDPDRAIRPGDAAPAGLAADVAPPAFGSAAMFDLPPGRPGTDPHPARHDHPDPRVRDRAALAAALRRAHPEVIVHRPAGYVRPGLVVLATDGPPDPVLARRLLADGQPHLAVHAGLWRGVVGPLVLPGRSSCLHCHDLYRRDRDAGWPRVRMALQRSDTPPPVVLATSVAAVGAGQALQFLGGAGRPATVDGTLESTAGDWTVRRRSWRPHSACFCHAG